MTAEYTTRDEARAVGAALYNTGRPCRHGHSSPRYASNEICVECAHASHRRHQDSHREELQRRDKERYPKERERRIQTAREQYLADPQKAIARSVEYNRQWRRDNPERHRAQVKKWAAANPRKRAIAEGRRRARRFGASGVHTYEDELRQLEKQGGLCFWCRQPLNGKGETDHFVPLSKGGSDGPENVVMACRPCNNRKAAKMPNDWIGGGIS